jgi:regulation of enolase protein 1 (concanavalin A-like superfamily)
MTNEDADARIGDVAEIGDVAWADGVWTTPPVAAVADGDALRVTAAEGSDALLAPLPVGSAMEVEFGARFDAEFDQAGLFVRADDEHWMKAGVEFSDGVLGVGAVVTDVRSDWSIGPVPEWSGRRVRVRVSRGPDALTLRVAADDEPLRLVRVVPFDGERTASAGPFVCAPTRAGLEVVFTAWRRTAADASLH